MKKNEKSEQPIESKGFNGKINSVVWEEKTHKKIVEKAIEMMAVYANQGGSNGSVKLFIDSFNKNPSFTDAMYAGLKDADDKSPWKDNNWERHFYNPKTGNNYNLNRTPSAYSSALELFKLSQHYAQRILYFIKNQKIPDTILYKNAGYYIGLSLHFFTDLTQPMHAANFTNVWGEEGGYTPRPDMRHAGFEVYTDNAIGRGLLNNLRPLTNGDLVPFPDNYVGKHIDQVASISKNIFDNQFVEILKKKWEKFYGYETPIGQGYWRAEEAEELLNQTTKLAPYYVANYLTNWILQANLEPMYKFEKWYKFQAPPKSGKNQVLEATRNPGSHWLVRSSATDETNRKFYIMPYPDGTVIIGCQDYLYNIWFANDNSTDTWIGFSNEDNKRPNRFRIVPYANNVNEIIIFESRFGGVLTLNEAGSGHKDNYKGSYAAYDSSSWMEQFNLNCHKLILVEDRDITPSEKKEIEKNYNNPNRHWAGDPGIVPDWEKELYKE